MPFNPGWTCWTWALRFQPEKFLSIITVQTTLQDNLTQAKEVQHLYFDKCTCKAPQYQTGDRAWLLWHNIASTRPSRKLGPLLNWHAIGEGHISFNSSGWSFTLASIFSHFSPSSFHWSQVLRKQIRLQSSLWPIFYESWILGWGRYWSALGILFFYPFLKPQLSGLLEGGINGAWFFAEGHYFFWIYSSLLIILSCPLKRLLGFFARYMSGILSTQGKSQTPKHLISKFYFSQFQYRLWIYKFLFFVYIVTTRPNCIQAFFSTHVPLHYK